MLVKTCNFREMQDEMIRDQLVEKTDINKVRERLLLESDVDLPRMGSY